jgi:hypothetical protein
VYLPVSPTRAVRAGWFAAWLAVVVVQAVLAVHSELGGHPDEPADAHAGEHCGLCVAAAVGGPGPPPAELPAASARVTADPAWPAGPTQPAGPRRRGREARAPPA